MTNSLGHILIAQRLITKDKDPGKWGPAAAGTMEQGETYESNAYKEAEEEIGLQDVKFVPGPKMKFEEPRKYFCQWFTAVCDKSADEFIPQPSEVEQVKWVTKADLVLDVESNPSNYVPAMSATISAFCYT